MLLLLKGDSVKILKVHLCGNWHFLPNACIGKSPVTCSSLVASGPSETWEGTSHGTSSLVLLLGQKNLNLHFTSKQGMDCKTVQCPMLWRTIIIPRECGIFFSHLALAVEGKRLAQQCCHWIPKIISLCPCFICTTSCLRSVRGEKPLPSLCPKLLLAISLFTWNPTWGPWRKIFFLILFWFSRSENYCGGIESTEGRVEEKGQVGTDYFIMNLPWNSKTYRQ